MFRKRKALSSPMLKTNQESQTLESVDVSQQETKASFNSLSNKLIKHLLPFTFVGAKEAARVLPTVSKRIDTLLKDNSVYHQLEVQAAFRHLVRGEQNKVKAILEETKKTNPNLLLPLLKTQLTITDHAKRQFDKITLFQLALWYLDRHMWQMLLEYLPKADAFAQLQEHELGQAAYVKEHGRHYDFEGPQGLVSALKNYVQLVDRYSLEVNWTQADFQWQREVGGAQVQAPLHVIHEYCRGDVPLLPLTETKFKEKTLMRDVYFQNGITRVLIRFWEGLGSGLLGTSLGLLYRASWPPGGGDGLAVGAEGADMPTAKSNFKAVRCLCQVRKEEYGLLKKDLMLEPDSSQEEFLPLAPKAGR